MKRFINNTKRELSTMKWYETSTLILFIVRCLYIFIPAVKVPGYAGQVEGYTYDTVFYFVVTALVELNLVYILYKKYRSDITEILCWIGVGNVIDQFTRACISWSITTIIWIIICFIYVYTKWKKKQE